MLSKFGQTLLSLVGRNEEQSSVTGHRKRRAECLDDDVLPSPAKRPCPESLQAEPPQVGSSPWQPKLVDWWTRTRYSVTKLVKSPFKFLGHAISPARQPSSGTSRANQNISSNIAAPQCDDPPFVPIASYNMTDPSHHRVPMSAIHSTPKRGNLPPSSNFDFSEMQQHIQQRQPNVTVGGDGQFKIPAPRPYPPPPMAVPPQQMATGRPPLRPTYSMPPRYNGTPGTHFNQSRNPYTPLYDKMYSVGSGRVSDTPQTKNKMAAKESIKLEEKKNYAQLLQQFTTCPLDTYLPLRTKKLDQPTVKQRSDETLLGTPFERPRVDDSKDKFTPHKVYSVKERPKDPKPGLTERSYTVQSAKKAEREKMKLPGAEVKHQGARPKERDVITLDDGDETYSSKKKPASLRISTKDDASILITGMEGPLSPSSPSSEIFEKALKASRFISEDWISDLQEKYSSDTRARHHQIKTEEDRVKFHTEKREEVDDHLLELTRRSLVLANRELPILNVDFDDEERPEEFPELTPEMESRIDDSLRPYPPNQVLVDAFRLQISRKDFATLDRLNWLNDEVINFYMELIRERGQQGDNARVHAFNTFFYPKLMKSGHSSVRRWTRQYDVFAKDYVLVPVHLGMHWCLSVIDFRKKEIRYYDSMGGTNDDCLNCLRVYLEEESMDKKKQQFDTSDWKLINVKNIPQQMNGSDCGVFTCKFADYITRGWNVTFTQANMPYFRRRMVYEIVTKQLL